MVLLVTGAVFVLPIAVVWELRSSRTVTSLWLLLLIAIAVSQGVSWALRTYWTRGAHRSDLLFSELLIWGWLWHLRSERRLASAARILASLEQRRLADPGPRPPAARATQASRWRVVRQLASALDAQDVYLHGHSRRVARHAELIGRRMRLSSMQLARLRAGAVAHDVGKLAVPRAILDKPGPLTEEEFAAVQRHADEGARLVAVLGDPEITAIVRHHHERIDGRGYPSRLAGGQIPLSARIVAVADTFDAITSLRPYRPAARHRQAIATLKDCAGTQLDAEAVKAFLASYAGRRQAFVLATLLAAPQQALARIAGGRPSSVGSSAANALAIVAVAVGVATAAAPGPVPFSFSSHLVATVPGLGGAVAAVHLRRSGKATHQSGSSGSTGKRSVPASRGAGTPAGTSHSPGGNHRSGGGKGHGGSGNGAGGRGGSGTGGGGGSGGGGGGSGGGHGGTGGGHGGTGGGTGGRGGGTGGGGGHGGGGPGGGGGGGGGGGPTPLSPGSTSCDGTYSGSGRDVVVPTGATCTLLAGTQVGHDVVVDPAGTLITESTSIGHDLTANGASGLTICGSSVQHDLDVHGASGPVTIGDSGSCAGNTVGHDLTVRGASSVTVDSDQVGHDLRVQGTGAVSGNNVGHDASCDGVTASSNVAGHKNGC